MRHALMRRLGSFIVVVVAAGLASGCGNGGEVGLDTTPPAAPTGLRAEVVGGSWRGAPVEGDGTIRLEWNPNTESDLAGYQVHSAMDGGAYELIGITPAGSTTFQDVRRPGHEYSYMAKAIDLAENESVPSLPASVRLLDGPEDPGI